MSYKKLKQDLIKKYIFIKYRNDLGKIEKLDNFSQKSFFNVLYNTLIEYDVSMKLNGKLSFELPLEFIISDRMDINACAFNVFDTDFIVFNQGAFLHVYEYFYALMADEKAFPYVGNPSAGKISSTRIMPTVNYGKGELLFHYGPRDTARQDFAFLLAYIGSLFIALHELGHHYNGHILHGNNSSKKCVFNKMYYNLQLSEKECMFSKTIEMDADAFAATNSLRILMLSLNNGGLPFEELKFLKSPIELLKIWKYAIDATFLVLGIDNIDVSNMKQSKYLPKRIRQILNISISEKVILNDFQELISNGQINPSLIPNILMEEMVIVERDFNRVNNLEMNVDDLLKQLNDDVSKHTDEVREHWNKVKPLLEPHARIPLAPYVM